MNLRRTWTILLACGAAALFATTPGASAKPGYVTVPGYRAITFSLKGSGGYRIHVEKRGRQNMLLAGGRRTAVAYVTRSPASKNGEIKTKLPGVGRISVRFRPLGSPRTSTPPSFPGCKSKESVKQRGYFVGTIRFRGEQGYTTARAKRSRGAIETVGGEVCKRSTFGEGSEPDADKTELFALSKSDGRTVAFSAAALTYPGFSSAIAFYATVAERRRGMAIFRNTFAEGEEGDFVPGDTRPFPLSATVTPPAPFEGSGEFQRDAEGNGAWTGSLTVSFPGLGSLALTGPDFSARLCQHSGCSGDSIDGHSYDRLRYP